MLKIQANKVGGVSNVFKEPKIKVIKLSRHKIRFVRVSMNGMRVINTCLLCSIVIIQNCLKTHNVNLKDVETKIIQVPYNMRSMPLVANRLQFKYVLKRVSFGSKDCTKELKLECAYFLGQTS